MRYRRLTIPGATYFFTVVTYRRRAILCEPDAVALLREAFAAVKQRHPFRMDAVVILPDHLHCLWTLPADDADYSTRWMLIKSHFTRHNQATSSTLHYVAKNACTRSSWRVRGIGGKLSRKVCP